MGRRCPIYFGAIFFMSVSWAMFSVITSFLLKRVVDIAQNGDVYRLLWSICGSIIGGIAALLIYKEATIIYNVEAKRAYGVMCGLLFQHEMHLPYTFFESHHSSEVMSKLSYDLEKVGSIFGSRLRRVIAPLLHVTVYLIPMLWLSWQVTFCLIGANLLLLMLNGVLIKPIQKNTKKLSKINQNMTERLSNMLQGMEQVRVYKAGQYAISEFIIECEKYEKESYNKILYTACLDSFNKGFDLLCSLIFLLLGAFFVQTGYTTLGALTAIYSLYGGFSSQFLQLGRYLPELLGCLVNAQNIFEFLKERQEPEYWYKVDMKNQQMCIEDEKNLITINKLSFSYHNNNTLISNYCLAVEKGKSVAVTGPSGCGKTTLSKILLGLYPIQQGNIYIYGKSIFSMSNKEVRSLIAYVPQEAYLFNFSIKENIRLGDLKATEDEIVIAAKIANAHEFILELDKKYDTICGEKGCKLSQGQRQRIALARAILKKANILVLDEATSALDNQSEKLINDAIKEMSKEKSIIIIAHRPTTIALADFLSVI